MDNMSAFKTFYKSTLPVMALYFVAHTAKRLLGRKTVRSAIRGEIRKFLTGSRELPYKTVPEVEHYADRIIDILNRKGVFPDSVCIDGPRPAAEKAA